MNDLTHEFETYVLGALLLAPKAYDLVSQYLPNYQFFHSDSHRVIYRVIGEMLTEGKHIDTATIHKYLAEKKLLERAGGIETIMDLTANIATDAHIETHAAKVAEAHIRRQTILIATKYAEAAKLEENDPFDLVESLVKEINEITAPLGTGSMQSLSGLLDLTLSQTRHRIDKRREAKEMGLMYIPGTTYGSRAVDAMTGAMEDSEYVLFAARPGMGKTAALLGIAKAIGLTGKAVALFSLEMKGIQLSTRLACAEAEIDSQRVKFGDLSEIEWENIVLAAKRLKKCNILIDDSTRQTGDSIRRKCIRLGRDQELGLIGVDRVGLIESKGYNRENEVSRNSAALLSTAKETNTPLIALAQLSRAVENRALKMPMLSDLRDSGSLEQDAETVIFLYRAAYYGQDYVETAHKQWLKNFSIEMINDLAIWEIAKKRDGWTGKIPMKWIGNQTKFEDYTDPAVYKYWGVNYAPEYQNGSPRIEDIGPLIP